MGKGGGWSSYLFAIAVHHLERLEEGIRCGLVNKKFPGGRICVLV